VKRIGALNKRNAEEKNGSDGKQKRGGNKAGSFERKRDAKANDKKQKTAKDFLPRDHNKSDDKNDTPNKKGKGKGGDKNKPIITRRQKQKVSDLIKNLRINYNKLLIKKKDLAITNAEKH